MSSPCPSFMQEPSGPPTLGNSAWSDSRADRSSQSIWRFVCLKTLGIMEQWWRSRHFQIWVIKRAWLAVLAKGVYPVLMPPSSVCSSYINYNMLSSFGYDLECRAIYLWWFFWPSSSVWIEKLMSIVSLFLNLTNLRPWPPWPSYRQCLNRQKGAVVCDTIWNSETRHSAFRKRTRPHKTACAGKKTRKGKIKGAVALTF